MKEKILNTILMILTIATATGILLTIPISYITEEITNNGTYEKIIQKEFGQVFQNYNEYLLYKIEKGEKENR